jgi:hypothetical protein
VASLSRPWEHQGERDEAQQLLAEPSMPPLPPDGQGKSALLPWHRPIVRARMKAGGRDEFRLLCE